MVVRDFFVGKPVLSKRETARLEMLPGGTSVDDDILDRAVADLNAIYVTKGLETAVAIGEYVLDAFFDGDLTRARNTRKKHVSFRALGNRVDLLVSYSFISNALGVIEQIELLPGDVVRALTLTHHKLLLPVRDLGTKVKLARMAAAQELPTRDFERAVRKVRAEETEKGPRVGRPPLPTIVKGLRRLSKAVDLTIAEVQGDDPLAGCPPDETRRLLGDLDARMKDLGDFLARVRASIDEVEAGQATVDARSEKGR